MTKKRTAAVLLLPYLHILTAMPMGSPRECFPSFPTTTNRKIPVMALAQIHRRSSNKHEPSQSADECPVDLTSQCTEQCVVITCDDPAHSASTCGSEESQCDLGCPSPEECHDCNGFDEFVCVLLFFSKKIFISYVHFSCNVAPVFMNICLNILHLISGTMRRRALIDRIRLEYLIQTTRRRLCARRHIPLAHFQEMVHFPQIYTFLRGTLYRLLFLLSLTCTIPRPLARTHTQTFPQLPFNPRYL